jgi:type I restriction enzyme R subunit
MRSKIKFWQMVGRGTRLCPDLFGPGDDKKEFMIFDFCQNLEFFEANPDGYEAGLQEPIKQRIFKQRLNIAHALQERGDTDDALKELEQGLKSQMHETVDSLNTDNFIVRKVRQTVESYSQRDSWNELSERDVAAISKQLTGLPSADDDHETARRFDLMILNLQASILEKTQAQVGYQKAIRVMAANLEEKKAIPDVASQMELLLALQTDDWWADVTLPMLEGVRRKLRNLAKFVDPNKQKETVFTDFEDEFQGKGKERPIITPNETLADYRTRVEKYIRDNQDHITIRRLRNNQPISKADISSLEDLLFEKEQLLPREQYSSIYGEKPLGLLVRSVVGLDRNAAKSVFADFISRSPLTPDQMRFLNEIIERLVKNGLMNPGELFEAPFTDFHSTGLFGVMGEQQAKEVVNLISEVQKRAEVG